MFEFLGSGTTRSVYYNKETLLVHKKTKDNYRCLRTQNANKNEVSVWNCVKGTDLEKHFLPVLTHSLNYDEIVVPFSSDVLWKEVTDETLVPAYWDDYGIENLGWFENRIVLRDYGDLTIYDLDSWIGAKTLMEANS